MKFKGFQKVSIIDYSGKLCAIVFTGGCNFRCHYCHNPELVIGWEKLPDIDEEEILKFMHKRKGLLDGLELTGGEPTLWQELPEFMRKIKEMGFLVKLDTNGTNPELLTQVMDEKLIDYIAMDIKATPERYKEIVGAIHESPLPKIKSSIKLIMQSSVDYEFRTTVFPEFFDKEDARQIGEWLKGAKRYVLQQPRTIKTLNGSLQNAKLYTYQELSELAKLISNCVVR